MKTIIELGLVDIEFKYKHPQHNGNNQLFTESKVIEILGLLTNPRYHRQ